MKKMVANIILITGIVLSLFQLYTGGFGVLSPILQRGVHLTLVLIMIYLIYPLSEKKYFRFFDYIAVILSLANGIYLFSTHSDLTLRVGDPSILDNIFTVLTLVLILEATRRLTGWILPAIAILFLFYAFYGSHFPGIFKTSDLSVSRITSMMYLSTDGIWGTPLGVAATFVALFILFGAFLNATGAGKIFIDLAFSIGGRFRGGPAKISIFASALMGTLSGSSVANVSTTGTFTIPLMKKVGINSSKSGAIEAVASTGGLLMPPVMGAGAFVMSEITGIPFYKIATAAIFPALLYYLSLFLFIDFDAAKQNISGLPKKELPLFWKTSLNGINLFLGIGALIYLLMIKQTSPTFAGFWSIIVLIITTIVFYLKKIKWKFLVEALEEGAKGMVLVTAACGTAGIIVGVINLTGIGVTLTSLMVNIGENSIFLTLILAVIACVIMGMGLPPTAAYIILGVLIGPALINLNIDPLIAHMFIFYFCCLAPITPPVALAAYVGAGIADTSPMKTSFQTARIGLIAFMIPFIFVYDPTILGKGNLGEISITFAFSMLATLGLAAFLSGWLFKNLTTFNRIIFFLGAILSIYPQIQIKIIGLFIICIIGITIFMTREKQEKSIV